MKHTSSLLATFLVLIPGCLQAQAGHAPPWVPVDCSSRLAELESFNSAQRSVPGRWRHFEESVRKAPEGSPLFAPKPFPRSREEILEDFRSALQRILLGDSELHDELEPARRILEASREDRLEIEIHRVENWALSRCGLTSPKPYSFLLRLFDGGVEVGRFVIHNTGLWGGFQPIPAQAAKSWILSLPRLDEGTVEELLRERFGLVLKVSKPQYVATEGLRWCEKTTPCVAFRARDRVYLLVVGRLLYRLDTEPDSLRSVSEIRRERLDAGPSAGLVLEPDPDNPLVSVGFAWTRATRIAGDPSSLVRDEN